MTVEFNRPPCHNVRDPMFDLLKYDPKIIVEIGSHEGSWAYRALEQCKNAFVFSVDPWEKTDIECCSTDDTNFGRWIEGHFNRLGRRILPLRMKSAEAAELFPFNVDMIFVDGMHTYFNAKQDAELWWAKMNKDGLMVFDNYEWPEVKLGVDDFCAENDVEINIGNANFKTAKRRRRTDCWFWK